jgi:hypothetical protein
MLVVPEISQTSQSNAETQPAAPEPKEPSFLTLNAVTNSARLSGSDLSHSPKSKSLSSGNSARSQRKARTRPKSDKKPVAQKVSKDSKHHSSPKAKAKRKSKSPSQKKDYPKTEQTHPGTPRNHHF